MFRCRQPTSCWQPAQRTMAARGCFDCHDHQAAGLSIVRTRTGSANVTFAGQPPAARRPASPPPLMELPARASRRAVSPPAERADFRRNIFSRRWIAGLWWPTCKRYRAKRASRRGTDCGSTSRCSTASAATTMKGRGASRMPHTPDPRPRRCTWRPRCSPAPASACRANTCTAGSRRVPGPKPCGLGSRRGCPVSVVAATGWPMRSWLATA